MARSPQTEVIHLDTHVVCWLYAGSVELLSVRARDAIERGQLATSPIVRLELQFLFEIGRIVAGPDEVLASLGREIGLITASTSFDEVVTSAQSLNWTRDVFDRLIVAGSAVARAPLVTKDRLIRRHHKEAIW